MLKVNTQRIEENLKNFIKEHTGIDTNFTVSVEERKGGIYTTVNSEDFASQTRPRMVKTITLMDNGSFSYENKKGEVVCLNIHLNYRYQHFLGGSNGTPFATLSFTLDGELRSSATVEQRDKEIQEYYRRENQHIASLAV